MKILPQECILMKFNRIMLLASKHTFNATCNLMLSKKKIEVKYLTVWELQYIYYLIGCFTGFATIPTIINLFFHNNLNCPRWTIIIGSGEWKHASTSFTCYASLFILGKISHYSALKKKIHTTWGCYSMCASKIHLEMKQKVAQMTFHANSIKYNSDAKANRYV